MKKLKVMNARMGDLKDIEREGYIFEPKLDGYRALCYVNETLKFISRNNIDFTKKYPELNFREAIKAQSAILDGEIVAYDEYGNPRFELMQQGYEATYVVFDILMLDGKLLTEVPLIDRKKILDSVITPAPHLEKIVYTANGQALLEYMKERHLEGVMAKRANGLYYPGERTNEWLKIKLTHSIDCVIIGFTPKKREIGSLALGLYDSSGKLTYSGNVGTGFSYDFLRRLHAELAKITVDESPVMGSPLKDVVWVQPILVAEIKYSELTSDGKLRAPVFRRLRFDKTAQECMLDQLIKPGII